MGNSSRISRSSAITTVTARADYAVFRPSSATWLIQQSRAGLTQTQFGEVGDTPVPADYDGDGKTDLAVFHPSNGNWTMRLSATNTTQTINWGLATDALVPADYDGDGKTDIAFYRNGNWNIRQASGGANILSFGAGSDLPTNRIQ